MNYNDPYRNLTESESIQLQNRIESSAGIERSHYYTAHSFQTAQSVLPKKSMFNTLRTYGSMVLVVFILSVSGSTFAAAESALPNSLLYSIKINVTEPLQGALRSTPESKIKWKIKQTERRLDETKQLILHNELTPQLSVDLQQSLTQTNREIQTLLPEVNSGQQNSVSSLSLELANTIENKNEEIIIAVQTASQQSTPEQTPGATISISSVAVIPEQVQSILAISEQVKSDSIVLAQKSEDTSKQSLLSNDTRASTKTTDEADSNISIQYALIINDIETKISEISVIAKKLDYTWPETKNADEITLGSNGAQSESNSIPEHISATVPETSLPIPADVAIVVSTQTIPEQQVPVISQNEANIVSTSVSDEQVELNTVTTTSDTSSIETEPTTAQTIHTVVDSFNSLFNKLLPTVSDIDAAKLLRTQCEILLVQLKSEESKKQKTSLPSHDEKNISESIKSALLAETQKPEVVTKTTETEKTSPSVPAPTVLHALEIDINKVESLPAVLPTLQQKIPYSEDTQKTDKKNQ